MRFYKITGLAATVFFKLLTRKRQKKREEATACQKKILKRLVRSGRATRFGKDHSFETVKSVESYQQSVPLRTYEQFWQDYWSESFPVHKDVTWPGKIEYFAMTSGTTTGVSKFIPCTKAMVRANNWAGMQVICEHFRNRPDSAILQGRYFMFAGSPNLRQLAAGVFAGELSGIAARETPAWAGRDRYYPPEGLAQLTDWQEKLSKISSDCLDKDIRAISGLPSWLQILFHRIIEQGTPKVSTLSAYFPKLELLVHGGMSFEPYRDHFARITEGLDVDFREIYAASEGFFAIADRGHGEGLRLQANNGIFYEFVPLDEFQSASPTRYWLGSIEPDIDYVIVVTTCAGLWSYVVGDIVRFTDVDNMRLVFSGRLSQTLSVFGEKILNEEIESAVAAAMDQYGLVLNDFAVASVFEGDTEKGRHVYLVETEELLPPDTCWQIAQGIDKALVASNSGYAARRKGQVGILEPEVFALKPGAFAGWMVARGCAGSQNKVPRILSEDQMCDLLARNNKPETDATNG